MLTPFAELLAHPRGATGALTAYDLETAQAVLGAARRQGRGVILLIARGAYAGTGGDGLLAALLALAAAAPVPACVQLDHVDDLELAGRALAAGAGAVMADGSALPMADNVAWTRAAVALAAAHGAAVEAELGGIAGAEDVAAAVAAGALTDPAEAAAFARETGVDCLAVSIGNVHGTYREPPRLDFARLEAIRAVVAAPLSLHGASGLPDADVDCAIRSGVRKVNVNTELRQAYLAATALTLPEATAGARLLDLHRAQTAAVGGVAAARLRAFGRTTVSRHSLGTGALGNQFAPVTDADAQATVEAAWAVGVRAFDTAPHYGAGVAERRLGAALAGLPRDAFVVSTKVGRRLVPARPGRPRQPAPFLEDGSVDRAWDFSADGVRRTLEDSLERLGLQHVDVVYLHDPYDHADQAIAEAYPVLHALRAEGVIGSVGVGVDDPPLLERFVTETDVDRLLLAGGLTLLDHGAADGLLNRCVREGVRVVAGGVLASGILADPVPGAPYDYAPAPPAVVARAQALAAVCAEHGASLLAAALQFPLRHPAVESVVVGARSAAEVRANDAALRAPVPAALWAALGVG